MKTNIRIIVQGSGESAEEFAKKLEGACENINKEFEETIVDNPAISHMTTASDGRQTATIQFLTIEDDEEFEEYTREEHREAIARAFYNECEKNQVDDDLPLELLLRIAYKAADNFLNSLKK